MPGEGWKAVRPLPRWRGGPEKGLVSDLKYVEGYNGWLEGEGRDQLREQYTG